MTSDLAGGGAQRPAAAVLGRALGGLFSVAGRVRPAAKPLHPQGSTSPAVLRRSGLREATGVPWVDHRGIDSVTVRLSRSVGLPGPLPDILGLAVRVPIGADQYGDLLLASTGLGPLSRFVLMPVRNVAAANFCTLLPYRTPTGPMLLAAVRMGGSRGLSLELQVGAPRGSWRRFASLEVEPDAAHGDDPIAFDPMTNVIPGLEPYEWVRQLREPAYRAARRSRGDARVAP